MTWAKSKPLDPVCIHTNTYVYIYIYIYNYNNNHHLVEFFLIILLK